MHAFLRLGLKPHDTRAARADLLDVGVVCRSDTKVLWTAVPCFAMMSRSAVLAVVTARGDAHHEEQWSRELDSRIHER